MEPAEALALDARSSPDAVRIVDAAQNHDLVRGDLRQPAAISR
jgi:hypothetical protein